MPCRSRYDFHSGSKPSRDKKQGRQMKIPERIAPRNPSMTEPKQMPIFMRVPGRRKERGSPTHIWKLSKRFWVQKMARKQAKMDSMGPIISDPTRQNPKIQLYQCSGYIAKKSHIMKKILMSKTADVFPRNGFDFKFLKRSYDLWLIFFLVYQVSRYSETSPEKTMQKTMAEGDWYIRKMDVVISVRIILGQFPKKLKKKVPKLFTSIPAAAELHPMKIIIPTSERSLSCCKKFEASNEIMPIEIHGIRLYMKKH